MNAKAPGPGGDEAVSKALETARQNPTDPHAQRQLAAAYHRIGRHDQAAEAYRKAIDLDPESPSLRNNLANVLADMGKLREAIDQYGRAVVTVRGEPEMAVFAFGSDTIDVYQVGDAMDARGWAVDRLQRPPNLHLMVTPAHGPIVDAFLEDLAAAAGEASQGPADSGTAAMYGALGSMSDRAKVGTSLKNFLDRLDQVEERER